MLLFQIDLVFKHKKIKVRKRGNFDLSLYLFLTESQFIGGECFLDCAVNTCSKRDPFLSQLSKDKSCKILSVSDRSEIYAIGNIAMEQMHSNKNERCVVSIKILTKDMNSTRFLGSLKQNHKTSSENVFYNAYS